MSSSRSVALRSTLVVAIVYVLASMVINITVGTRSTRTLDRELSETLSSLGRASTTLAPGRPVIGYFSGPTRIDPDDKLDKVPVAYWWVPANGSAYPADSALPALPPSLYGVSHPQTTTIAGLEFRVSGMAVRGGNWVAAMSTAEAQHDTVVLEMAEVILLPLVLTGFFLTAYLIGHRAASPVEEARRKLLAFTADASHELRTPLSVIEAEVGLSLSTPRDAEFYRSSLEKVSAETGRLKKIVEELLWLARFDSGPRRPATELVDLSAAASEAAHRFEALAAQRHVTVEVREAEEGAAIVHAPPEWLDRLISVLIDNACRYTAPGTCVRVAVEQNEQGPTVTVDDEGPGIPEAERDRIFQRFHRATNTKGGSGLGLAIADAVVGATGGRWTVASSPSGGARMQVTW